MSAGDAVLGLMVVGLTLYLLLGGADFGAGLWDLLAGSGERGRAQRELVSHSVAPVWEANHVWLIFVIVLFWTGFPPAFAAFASTLYVPLTLVAFGVIARGSAFAFRKVSEEPWQERLFGAVFATSSVLTPFLLGTLAGAVASDRVPPGIATGDVWTSWLNPTSLATGLLTSGICAYIAAVYLTADARRTGDEELTEAFRRRALVTGAVVGGLGAGLLVVVYADARPLFDTILTRSWPFLGLSVLAGIVSLVMLVARAYVAVRITAALAVAAVIWGWAAAEYPELLPGLSVDEAAGSPAVLEAVLWALGIGGAILVPSLLWLFTLFQSGRAAGPTPSRETGRRQPPPPPSVP